MKNILLLAATLFAALQTGFAQISKLADINLGSGPSTGFQKGGSAQMGGLLFFSADNGLDGVELWKTDGTVAGTELVKDINPGAGSSEPDNFNVVGNLLLFTADDGVSGAELWATDGTEAGTKMLADIRPGAAGAFADWFLKLDFHDFHVFKNTLFFRAYTSADGLELYKSDGTAAGTALVKSIGGGQNDGCQGDFAELNGELYFVGFTTTDGGQIWKTDGTGAGTVAVTTALNETPEDLVALGGKLIFVEDDGTSGPELWSSDGTAAGTALLKDTDTGAGSGGLKHMVNWPENRFFVSGDKAYFSVLTSASDPQLWVTDGTAAGTKKLKSTGSSSCPPSNFAQLGNLILFTACKSGVGDQLWVTNGTAGGTQAIQSFLWGVFPSDNTFKLMHSYNGRVWFGVEESSGDPLTLYSTDGTAAGTAAVSSPPINGFYDAKRFINFGDKLVFWAAPSLTSTNVEPYITSSPVAVGGPSASALGLSLAPNPAADRVRLSLGEGLSEALECRLFDSMGRLLRSFTLPAGGAIDLAGLPGGPLVLRVMLKDGRWESARFLKMD